MIDYSDHIELTAIKGIPEVAKGDDLPSLILDALHGDGASLADKDIVVIAHKVVSKAEGSTVRLADVEPSKEANELAAKLNRDPRKVEVILRESRRVVRAKRRHDRESGVLICEHRLGFISANAAVDQSNSAGEDTVILLPRDPDRSAREIREKLSAATGAEIGVIITDSFGRPWRLGIVNVAIGVAGVPALNDVRGTADSSGRELHATVLAVADELAAAAGLLMGKTEGVPAVLIRGLRWTAAKASAKDILRPNEHSLF